MKKIILACLCILAATAAFSLTVDVSEISKAKAIRFENYTGNAARSDSPAAVAAIGFMMLTGRMNWRFGATAIIGVFILFGATTIVAGIQSAAG